MQEARAELKRQAAMAPEAIDVVALQAALDVALAAGVSGLIIRAATSNLRDATQACATTSARQQHHDAHEHSARQTVAPQSGTADDDDDDSDESDSDESDSDESHSEAEPSESAVRGPDERVRAFARAGNLPIRAPADTDATWHAAQAAWYEAFREKSLPDPGDERDAAWQRALVRHVRAKAAHDDAAAAAALPEPPSVPKVEKEAVWRGYSGGRRNSPNHQQQVLIPCASTRDDPVKLAALRADAAKAGHLVSQATSLAAGFGSVAIMQAMRDRDVIGLRGACREFPAAVNLPCEDATREPEHVKVRVCPNLKGPILASPLTEAARSGNVDIMEVLLQHGADPNAIDSLGGFPLQYCAGEGDAEGCRLLLRYGADSSLVNAQFTYFGQPLTAARVGEGKLPASLVEELEGTTRSCEHCAGTFPASSPPPTAGRCAKCRACFFCSQVCQKQAWPHHKKMCKLVAAGPAAVVAKYQAVVDEYKAGVDHAAVAAMYKAGVGGISGLEFLDSRC